MAIMGSKGKIQWHEFIVMKWYTPITFVGTITPTLRGWHNVGDALNRVPSGDNICFPLTQTFFFCLFWSLLEFHSPSTLVGNLTPTCRPLGVSLTWPLDRPLINLMRTLNLIAPPVPIRQPCNKELQMLILLIMRALLKKFTMSSPMPVKIIHKLARR